MKIIELEKIGIEKLTENNIEDSLIKARRLLCFCLNKDTSYLINHGEETVNSILQKQYENLLEELIQGKPLQYITNKQEFMKLNFYVDENVLIPQPDTEILVEEALKKIQKINKEKIKILDIATGSGAIAVAIAYYIGKKAKVYAADISQDALNVAKKNAEQNNVEINFILSNMFENINEKFDIIVSNPPYVESKIIKNLPIEVKHEPHIALDGGIDGLHFYRIFAKEAFKYLEPNGSMLLEIGYNQKESVMNLFKESNIECIKDLSGNDRVISLK